MKLLQHAGTLKEQLLSLGFPGGLEQELLFQLCFLPTSFSIQSLMQFGPDHVLFALQFERSEPSGEYRCLYFDATLRKQVVLEESGSAAAKEVVALMETIPWSALSDAASMRIELAGDIEKAVASIEKLAVSAEGKYLADTLRYKYWSDTVFAERMAIAPGIRSRFEVRQHFYLFDGEARITARDAYLFLNNKWLQKQFAGRKRSGGEETADAGPLKKGKVSRKKPA